ncbi:MAG: hypothetical protein PHD46_08070 [Eubacteriales bacterium]|nr:hypothetical protein [Eubacteriales bacterium]MDD4422968.1 hypothetical protein [Eubacteriales bacterium]HBR31652.1 hypothetical protein [Clostridiales bacterium]
MSTPISQEDFLKLKTLFMESFDESDALAEEIVGYAKTYGEIRFLSDNGKVITMLCLAELEDGYKYLFAVATSPSYRGRGLFSDNFSVYAGKNENIICIPQSDSLFSLYRKLGFTQEIFIFNTSVVGDGSLRKHLLSNYDMDFEMLYRIYKSSCFYPKKPKELFMSTMRCHLLYGGTVISDGSFYALCGVGENSRNIYEICVPKGSENRAAELIKGCVSGVAAASLAADFTTSLRNSGLTYNAKRIAAFRQGADIPKNNINNSSWKSLYINILYN